MEEEFGNFNGMKDGLDGMQRVGIYAKEIEMDTFDKQVTTVRISGAWAPAMAGCFVIKGMIRFVRACA